MSANNQISFSIFDYIKTSFFTKNFSFILVVLAAMLLIPAKITKSEEIFLKCTGKFEINRGKLIKPDWEISYLTINLNGIKSFINYKGVKEEGRTLIRRNTYTITHRDKSNRIKAKYKINGTYGNYVVDFPKSNRTLIGTCQKGRG